LIFIQIRLVLLMLQEVGILMVQTVDNGMDLPGAVL
ncbi:unnamed protein product, partial [marine sediment metagenome]